MDKKFWSRIEIRQLIARYKENPVLWDTNSEDYKNIVKKRKAQKKLATEFNTTIVELGRKIRILRAQWLKEFKKMKEQADEFGGERVYVSNWIWFQPLQFIFTGVKNPEDDKTSEDWTLEQTEPSDKEIDEQSHDDIYLYLSEESIESNDDRYKNLNDRDINLIENNTVDTNMDEYQIFGKYVANKLSSLHFERNIQELKRLILQNIEQWTLKDNSEYYSM